MLVGCRGDDYASAPFTLITANARAEGKLSHTGCVLVMIIGRPNHPCHLFTIHHRHVHVAEYHIKPWFNQLSSSHT
jgi:hypothetical protein